MVEPVGAAAAVGPERPRLPERVRQPQRGSLGVAEPVGELAHAGRRLEDDTATVARRAWGILVAGDLGTGALLAAVYWPFPNPLAGVDVLPGAVALWSVFISIVALPHVAAGSVLDADRGIWCVP